MSGKNYSLQALVRRLVFSFVLLIAGSWLLLLPRLGDGLLKELSGVDWSRLVLSLGSVNLSQAVMFDFIGLSLIFLGFFMAIYYRGRLRPRLRRLRELGEDRW